MSLREQFSTLPPRRQLSVTLAAVAIVSVLLAALYFLFVRQPYVTLFNDLRPADAATIKAELDKNNTPYKLAAEGTTILAPRDVVDATRLEILSQDLPLKGAIGFELFNKSDIGLTEFAQKINYQRALQGELARTIMTLESIDSARVHLSMPDQTIFREDRRPPKGSVTLAPRKGQSLSIRTVRGVQRLVAAAVPDLEIGNVVVLDAKGGVLTGGNDPAFAQSIPSSGLLAQPNERSVIEQYYAARVLRALSLQFPTAVSQVDVRIVGGPSSEALEDWTPQNRAFGLTLEISTTSLQPAEVEQEMRLLAAEAAGVNPALGDNIRLTVLETPTAAIPSPSPRAAVPLNILPRPASRDPVIYALSGLLALLVVLAVVLAVLGQRRRKAMTPEEREVFVRRFNELLDERDAHATR